MASRHLSLRMESETFDRLDAQSRRTRQSRSQLAKTLLEEGLRMQAHPAIVFRSGPAGRRAGLAGGPDVWEVVCVLGPAHTADAVKQAADSTGLTVPQVKIAARYYDDYREEIDEWIRRVDEEADAVETIWRRGQGPPTS